MNIKKLSSGLFYVPPLNGRGGLGYKPSNVIYGGTLTTNLIEYNKTYNDEPIPYALELYNNRNRNRKPKALITNENFNDDVDLNYELLKKHLYNKKTDKEDKKNIQEVIKAQEHNNALKSRVTDYAKLIHDIAKHKTISPPIKKEVEQQLIKAYSKSIKPKPIETIISKPKLSEELLDQIRSTTILKKVILDSLKNGNIDEAKNVLVMLNSLYKYKKLKIENNKLVEVPKELIKKATVTNKAKEKEDDLYKTLVKSRSENTGVNNELWKQLENNKQYNELMETYYNLKLGNLETKIDELENGTYKKPDSYKSKKCDEFEQKFKNKEVIIPFLEQTVTNFNKNDIFEIKIIHTETDYENIKFNGEEFNFKADKYFPMDVLVLIKTKKGEVKKYAIELKYYDNLLYYGIVNKKGNKVTESGSNSSFLNLCKLQEIEYEKYTQRKFFDLIDYKDSYKKAIIKGNKTEIKEFKNKINELEKLINNNEAFNESFNKNVYSYYVSMKFTKGGYAFQNKPTDENDYNTKEIYEHLQKYNTKQNIIRFNTDGKIRTVESGKERRENLNFNIMKGAEVIYCISMSDAILGLNYSNEINKNKKLVDNPFYSHKLMKSNYGKTTDSIGLKLENLQLIKK